MPGGVGPEQISPGYTIGSHLSAFAPSTGISFCPKWFSSTPSFWINAILASE